MTMTCTGFGKSIPAVDKLKRARHNKIHEGHRQVDTSQTTTMTTSRQPTTAKTTHIVDIYIYLVVLYDFTIVNITKCKMQIFQWRWGAYLFLSWWRPAAMVDDALRQWTVNCSLRGYDDYGAELVCKRVSWIWCSPGQRWKPFEMYRKI